MYLIKIYLTNTVIIELNCEQYEVSQNKTTGEVSGYCFKNSNKYISYIDKSNIVAITAEEIK